LRTRGGVKGQGEHYKYSPKKKKIDGRTSIRGKGTQQIANGEATIKSQKLRASGSPAGIERDQDNYFLVRRGGRWKRKKGKGREGTLCDVRQITAKGITKGVEFRKRYINKELFVSGKWEERGAARLT